ncbi:MAG TPA: phosphoribosylamine--glycine ligase [Hypericibacter adhaerens]|jgi:phosphoribosylamine--glycine ligase|uniref:phosphoribosylamine--glycine ligase n=1 Tax=Hypericibacter adhaerens TaxID=2602016 RepID=UPI002C7224CD|nr:phosphoribosylamine--glycine ligase [Hypericibacter adhaerens]HWA46478.1 phosphoribosylamine--glycine ligase [Hypericibacter adhaerens]
MRILVVGSGGREHALCWAIAASPLCDKLYCAPGNAGIAAEAECVPIKVDELDKLVGFARDSKIDFVVVGPEAPLVAGLADKLRAAGIKTFGPSGPAAALEGSKSFMKELCAKYGIPTAAFRRFTEAGPAKAYVRERGVPIVVKADGLAAGKGVVVAQSLDEADKAIESMLVAREFGTAGAEIVVEEFLSGEEASFFALVDGKTALPLASAQDHKTVGEGDTGPNTGGMGAYSPAPIVTDAMAEQVMRTIILPTVKAMEAEGRPFTGVLFAGLMIGPKGPRLLEYNVRFGDPECQVLCLRLMSDILPALIAAADGMLAKFHLRWKTEAALTVVMAAQGYPGAYKKGTEIRGLDRAAALKDVVVFHAGTERSKDGRVLATGGRVLGVSALGKSVAEAQARAYAAVDQIDWPEGFCRRDIGWRAIGARGGEAEIEREK